MDLEHTAIDRLKAASDMSLAIYDKPLSICYSGGKDSEVLLDLAIKAKIPMIVAHSHTTADAPETVRHIRTVMHRLEDKGVKTVIAYPTYKGEPISMWKLIPQKLMPPTRLVRYCCATLKETYGKDSFIATGVRWDESTTRKSRSAFEIIGKSKAEAIHLNNDNDESRKLFENCELKAKRVVNPIIDWKDDQIWDYCSAEKLNLNPLYYCGFNRVGCIGCPMASKMQMEEFRRYPKYRQMYVHAFDRMIEERVRRGKDTEWKSGEEVFHWWVDDGVLPGQEKIAGFE